MLVGLVFFVFKSLLGIARPRSRTKFTIWTLKLRSHVRMSIYRMGYFLLRFIDLRSYLISIDVNCIVHNYPRTDLDTISRAWKVCQDIWVLSSDADHHRPRPAAV